MEKEKMKSEIMSLFGTPVAATNINRDFTEDELQFFLEDIPMKKYKEHKFHNHPHRSEDFCLFDNFTDILGNIKTFCEYHLKFYLEELEGVDTNLAKLRITQSWLNKTKPQEFHHPHCHANSYLSGVLYISCLPNDGINFENPFRKYDNLEFMRERITEWNSNITFMRVKEGDLIIFPSWIKHSVNINETKDSERISLSFNTFPVGKLGEYDSATLLEL